MNSLKLHLHLHHHHHNYRLRSQLGLRLQPSYVFFPSFQQKFNLSVSCAAPFQSFTSKASNVDAAALFPVEAKKGKEDEEDENEEFEEYLAEDGDVYRRTLRLVECAMFAAVSGLAFLLSSSLATEKYFACFFALPIVLSTMRWGIAAGRKTMIATTVLLFVISGPIKAITYLLMHGLLGFAIGTFWRLRASWGASVFCCSLVRAIGALGNVVIVSYLIGENILALITINVHALVTYALSSRGFIVVPSMNVIYIIFGFILLLNCASFVFLLHLLYAVFFTRLGMKDTLRLPKWLEAAI